jgi:peptidoglycan/xylan/chitin deacetylase (PgdA/CDA1 family)
MNGTFVVSLDFELYWGVRDKRTLESYRENLLGVRTVVPRLLELFAEYGLHATWATVGFLFCETKDELIDALPERRPRYRDARLSPYGDLPALGPDEERDPFHYAPSLIRQIAAAPGQEIGTHTFSHFYCLEEGQDAEDFEADLRAAVAVAERRGITLESLVLPRNQVNEAYLPIARRLGIRAYRSSAGSWLYTARAGARERQDRRALRLLDAYANLSGHSAYPLRDAGRLPRAIPASRFLRPHDPRLTRLEPLRVRRIVRDLEHAASHGLTYHLWWHPHNFGAHTDRNLDVLRRILDRFAALREAHGMESRSMDELAPQSGGVPAGADG